MSITHIIEEENEQFLNKEIQKGVVIGHVVNLYIQPSNSTNLVTQAIMGTEVAIRGSRDEWFLVSLPDDYQGWIEASQVHIYHSGEISYASTGQVAEIINLLAFLYFEPSVIARSPALQLPISTRLEVLEAGKDWTQVILPDLSLRWIQNGDIKIEMANTPRYKGRQQELIDTAKRFLGLPYMWGGTTPLGFDCSGFVQLVYHLNGISLLRDTDLQFDQPGLENIQEKDLQAGDLVFFGQEIITHVGMYYQNRTFIHATSYQCPIVRISNLDDPHWIPLYKGARRP